LILYGVELPPLKLAVIHRKLIVKLPTAVTMAKETAYLLVDSASQLLKPSLLCQNLVKTFMMSKSLMEFIWEFQWHPLMFRAV